MSRFLIFENQRVVFWYWFFILGFGLLFYSHFDNYIHAFLQVLTCNVKYLSSI